VNIVNKIKTFFIQVIEELKKVSWSSREELMGATVVVIVITFIMSAFIGVVDIALSKALSLIFK
jgi:preprotein translocase subunit SecE